MSTTPDILLRLVDRFDSDRKACPERAASDAVRSRRVFPSSDYKEEQLRAEHGQRVCRLRLFCPFSAELGWNMNSTLDTLRTRE